MAFRLLHVLPSLDIRSGGPLRLVIDLAERARSYGLDSEVLGTGAYHLPDCPLAKERIHWCPGRLGGTYSYTPALRQWLRAHLKRFDGALVHGAWTYSTIAAARECQRQRIPYGVIPHGMLDAWAVNGQGRWKAWKKHLYWRFRENRVYQAARCIYFTTRREQERSQPVFALPSRQAVLPVYGIEATVPKVSLPENLALRRPPGERWALYLGRVHPKKNIELLIRAWGDARPPEPWRLLIVGPGEARYVTALRRLAQELELEDQVRFLDLVTGIDKAYLFQQSEWFLLPSRQENFGVAVLEAIAHGCAVAISDQVYIGESFPADAEILGLAVDVWAEFLAKRMVDEEWRRARIETDRKYLLQSFEINRVASHWAAAIPATLAV
jgi:glycosyltransferase involved in cell wall biosynthesis